MIASIANTEKSIIPHSTLAGSKAPILTFRPKCLEMGDGGRLAEPHPVARIATALLRRGRPAGAYTGADRRFPINRESTLLREYAHI